MSEIVRAPFTREQVMVLNNFQEFAFVHPFTCANNGNDVLVATVRGWICPFCDYTQDWCHAAMLSKSVPMYLPDDHQAHPDAVKRAIFGDGA